MGQAMRIVFALAVMLGICTGAAAQQPQNYALQPGDTIEVSVWNEPEAKSKGCDSSRRHDLLSFGRLYSRLWDDNTRHLRRSYQNALGRTIKQIRRVTVTLSEVWRENCGVSGIHHR